MSGTSKTFDKMMHNFSAETGPAQVIQSKTSAMREMLPVALVVAAVMGLAGSKLYSTINDYNISTPGITNVQMNAVSSPGLGMR